MYGSTAVWVRYEHIRVKLYGQCMRTYNVFENRYRSFRELAGKLKKKTEKKMSNLTKDIIDSYVLATCLCRSSKSRSYLIVKYGRFLIAGIHLLFFFWLSSQSTSPWGVITTVRWGYSLSCTYLYQLLHYRTWIEFSEAIFSKEVAVT